MATCRWKTQISIFAAAIVAPMAFGSASWAQSVAVTNPPGPGLNRELCVEPSGNIVFDNSGGTCNLGGQTDVQGLDFEGNSAGESVEITGEGIELGENSEISSKGNTVVVDDELRSTNDIKADDDVRAGDEVSAGTDVKAGRDVLADNDVKAGDDVRAQDEVEAGTDVKAGRDVLADNDVKAGDDVRAGDEVSAGTDVKAGRDVLADNDIKAGDDVRAQDEVEAGTDVIAGRDVTAHNGTVTGKHVVAKESFTVGYGAIVDMGMNRVQGVADPVDPYDAANKRYVDNEINKAFDEIDKNREGIALAMAMSGLVLPNNKHFALGVNFGFFDTEQAVAAQTALRLNETFTFIGGVGVGLSDENSVGGRAGIVAAW